MIQVVGRHRPVRVYEPLAFAGEETGTQATHAHAYAEGLARWRKADFAGAAELFGSVADADPPSMLFMHRANQFLQSPSPPGWQPITVLEAK
jgi:adenylate cyclase